MGGGGGGGGFIMGGWEILKVSSHISQRGANPPYFKKTPYTAYPPPSTSLSLQPHPHCSFCCPVSLAEWVITSQLMCYFT